MIIKKLISLALFVTVLFTYSLPVFAVDSVIWPYDPNWPANIAHRNVPTEAPEPPALAPGLDSIVVRTYPEGRMKAFLFAFDDGGTFMNKAGDNYVLSILNKYHLRGTFFLMMKDGLVNYSKPDQGVYSSMGYSADAEGYKKAIREIYAGHEVTAHTITHSTLDILSFPDFKWETSESQRRFEECTGTEVAAVAYPYDANTPDGRDGTTLEEKNAYLKSIGFRYVRRSIKASYDVTYDIPKSFFDWQYDHRIIDNSDDNVNTLLPNYFNMDTKNKMKVMFYFAHAWQIAGPEDAKIKIRANYEKMCQMLEDQKKSVWNTTILDFVDYVNASRLMQIKYVGDGDVSIYNPSQEITCWATVAGNQVSVAPGETIIVTNPIEIEYKPSTYVAKIANDVAVEGNILTDVGITTVVTDNAQVSKNADGQVELVQTITSQDTDYIGLSAPWLINPTKTTMVDIKYKVKADSYSADTPLTAMTFSMPTVGIVGKAKASTLPVAPTQDGEDAYKTMRIAIDNSTKTVYYSDNGSAFVPIKYNYDISYLRHLRIYPTAYPANGTITEGVSPLASPITWTFDSISIYQPTEEDILKISSAKVNGSNVLDFNINVRNYGLGNQDFTIVAGLYEKINGVPTLVKVSSKKIIGLQPMFFANDSVSFDVSGIQGEYYVKALIWEGIDNPRPYDSLTLTQSQIQPQ